MPDVDPVTALRLYARRILELTSPPTGTLEPWADAVEAALHAAFGDDALLGLHYMIARLEVSDGPIDDDALLAETLTVDLPAWWEEWTAERERQRHIVDAEMAHRAERAPKAWDAFWHYGITAEQRDAWIRDGIDPFADEVAALIAAAEAYLQSPAEETR